MEKTCGNKCCNLIKRSSENISSNIRSSRPEVFLRKGVLKICRKFQCNFNKVAFQLRHGCSPVNLLHISRTPFPRKTFGCLLLNYHYTFIVVLMVWNESLLKRLAQVYLFKSGKLVVKSVYKWNVKQNWVIGKRSLGFL